MNNENEIWACSEKNDLTERWPKNEKGEPEEPVLLCTCRSVDLCDELKINMLEAYGVPCLRIMPGNGSFGKVVLGMSGQGSELYVPKSMYDEAVELCKEENNEDI